MARRIPIVATDVGGVAEMIKDQENGLLVESNNVEQLAQAIRNIIIDSDLAGNLAKQAFKDYQSKYQVEQMIESYDRLFTETLSK